MPNEDRVFFSLRGDEVVPFVQVDLSKSDVGPVASVKSKGRPRGLQSTGWPPSGVAGHVLGDVFERCQRQNIQLRVALNGVEWDQSWGRLG